MFRALYVQFFVTKQKGDLVQVEIWLNRYEIDYYNTVWGMLRKGNKIVRDKIAVGKDILPQVSIDFAA